MTRQPHEPCKTCGWDGFSKVLPGSQERLAACWERHGNWAERDGGTCYALSREKIKLTRVIERHKSDLAMQEIIRSRVDSLD